MYFCVVVVVVEYIYCFFTKGTQKAKQINTQKKEKKKKNMLIMVILSCISYISSSEKYSVVGSGFPGSALSVFLNVSFWPSVPYVSISMESQPLIISWCVRF